MFKKHWKMIVITSLITLLPMLAGLILWDRLPDMIATHFNAQWEPDGWSSKLMAVVGLPLFLVLMHLVCLFATTADPKKQNISDKVVVLVMWLMPAVSLLCGALTYSVALGHEAAAVGKFEFIVPVFVGLLFALIGCYLPKCKQNYTVGIKVPWALNDEENWDKTHRFGGKVWIVGGILFALTGLLGVTEIGFVAIVVMALLPVIYSYLLYRKKNK